MRTRTALISRSRGHKATGRDRLPYHRSRKADLVCPEAGTATVARSGEGATSVAGDVVVEVTVDMDGGEEEEEVVVVVVAEEEDREADMVGSAMMEGQIHNGQARTVLPSRPKTRTSPLPLILKLLQIRGRVLQRHTCRPLLRCLTRTARARHNHRLQPPSTSTTRVGTRPRPRPINTPLSPKRSNSLIVLTNPQLSSPKPVATKYRQVGPGSGHREPLHLHLLERTLIPHSSEGYRPRRRNLGKYRPLRGSSIGDSRLGAMDIRPSDGRRRGR